MLQFKASQTKTRILGVLAVLFISTGLGLLWHAHTLNPYTDSAAYESKYAALNYQDSEQFYQLRETYLTPKYIWEDYGRTGLLCGICALVILFVGSTPNQKWMIILIGFTAAITTSIGGVYRLNMEFLRGSYPPWGDTLAIPIVGSFILLLLLIVWVIINSATGLTGTFKPGISLGSFSIRKAHKVYLFFLAATILILLYAIVGGGFEWIIPAVLWAYFYLSIILGHQNNEPKPDKITSEVR